MKVLPCKYALSNQIKSIILISILLLILLPFTMSFNDFWRIGFCMPSAEICSLFLGSHCQSTDQGYMLIMPSLSIHVIKSCSAASFFVLMFALITSVTITSLKKISKLIWILPLAYIITIAANSARILAGWITGRGSRLLLPESFWPSVHLITGVVVFFSFLVVTYFIVLWKSQNGRKNIIPSYD